MKPNFETQSETRYSATKRLTLISASTNTLLALLKVTIGYLCHSQALIADGFHSFSDLISDGLVLIATRIGGQIPDKEHPYGHQRVETIAAIILALLMLAVGISIFYSNFHYIFSGHVKVSHNIPVLFIAILSIIANEGLYRYNRKVGERIHSNLLISNAYHNRSDAYTSAIVVLAAIGMFFGMHYFDAAGAIIIAALIIKMGIQIFWNNVQELIDAGVDAATLKNILACIETIPGVASIHQLRTRMHSGTILVDVHIIVDPRISVSEGHYIGEQITLKLVQNFLKITDVVVHVDPEDDEAQRPSVHLPSRQQLLQQLQPYWQSLPGYAAISKITIHYLNGQIYLDIILPLALSQEHSLINLTEQYQHITTILPIAEVNVAFLVSVQGVYLTA